MEAKAQEIPNDEAWNQIFPILNEALNQLRDKDRDALLLRFFKGKSFSAVGAGLGISEDAAKKRVGRALEKLRGRLSRHGVVLPAVILVATLSVNAVQAAPTGLSASVAAMAVSKGAAATGSTLSLTKATLKLMAWTKAKTAVISGVAALLVAGTATVTVKKLEAHRMDESWRTPGLLPETLSQIAPQVHILPSKFPPFWPVDDVEAGDWHR